MEEELKGEFESLDSQFVEWAKNRMVEMDREAEQVTRELGLPKEAKFNVLKALYGGPRQGSGPERSTSIPPSTPKKL